MRTFEEILIIAKSSNVDFVLLGGDLFHHNKPTRQTLFNTMQMYPRPACRLRSMD